MIPRFPKKKPTNDNPRPPGFWIVTALGAGLLRPAPGTWGSLAALLPGWLLLHLGGPLSLVAALVGLGIFSFHPIRRYEESTGRHDDPRIVIDEVLGMGIALLATDADPLFIACAFALFRFFDILKPGPVGWLDRRLQGPAGVLADDILAGVLAGLCTGALRYAVAG